MKRTIVSLGMLMVVGCGQREVLRFVPAAPGYAVERPVDEEGSADGVKAAHHRVAAASRLGERIAASERALRHPAADPTATPAPAARPVAAEGSAVDAATAPPALVDLNTATLAELDALPRVGPAMAARIVAKRPFRRADDLRRVSGVGPSTFRALRPLVTVSVAQGTRAPQPH
jgi:competence protein ComEA